MTKRSKGLFDLHDRQQKIDKYKDPLKTLKTAIDWEGFRPIIESAFVLDRPSKVGRPPYDKVFLFKILVLQHYYNLSDEQTEFQIVDRMTFMRFLDLELHQSIPDSNTTRNFREALTQAGKIDEVFNQFSQRLYQAGLIGKEGRIVDASFVAVPRQRNSREENNLIKQGQTPPQWSDKKKAHKDVDASWTKKNNELHFGYKNHIVMDDGSKLIVDFQTTAASEHDGNVLEDLLQGVAKNMFLYGDSAYSGQGKEDLIRDKGLVNRIHEKGKRNHPLTPTQKTNNRIKSQTRARVEHAFAWMHRNQQQLMVKTIGIDRATAKITFMNLLYNMTRGIYLLKTTGRTVVVL